MKIKILLLTAAIVAGFSLKVSAQAINVLREAVFPIDNMFLSDGYYMSAYDFHFAPMEPHMRLMGVNGNPKSMIQNMDVKVDRMGFNIGQTADTIMFNGSGGIAEMYSKFTYDDVTYYPNRVALKYNPDGSVDEFNRYTIEETYTGPQERYDNTKLVYAGGKLVQEKYTMYNRVTPSGEWEISSSFNNEIEFEYFYREEKLASARLKDFDHKLHYNSDGLLHYVGSSTFKLYSYVYDAEQHIVEMTSHITDEGMDEVNYYKRVVVLTRNNNGDIIKVVDTRNPCTSKWVVKRKGRPVTTLVSYTYDEHGNWTQATITRGKKVLVKIKRKYTY